MAEINENNDINEVTEVNEVAEVYNEPKITCEPEDYSDDGGGISLAKGLTIVGVLAGITAAGALAVKKHREKKADEDKENWIRGKEEKKPEPKEPEVKDEVVDEIPKKK